MKRSHTHDWIFAYNKGLFSVNTYIPAKISYKYSFHIPIQDVTDKHLRLLETSHAMFPDSIYYIIVRLEIKKRGL